MFWVRSDLDCRNNLWGGGGGVLEPNSRTGVFWRIWSKISGSPLAGASQIVSHILRMWRLIKLQHNMFYSLNYSCPHHKWSTFNQLC